MNITIKSEIPEPICMTSIKEEPKSSDEEDDNIPPIKPPKTVIKSENVKLIPKKKKNLQGMKATELRQFLQTDVIRFCQRLGMVASSVICRCGQPMVLSYQKKTSDGALWSCRKGSDHCVTVTLRKGTWFEKSRLTLAEILWIAYMWLHEYSYKSILHETDNSPKTVVDWCTCCRDACRAILECKSDPLGGSINLVEVFECKFAEDKKRKKSDTSRWVFFGLEQFSTKAIQVIVDNKRSETIVDIYNKYILPGTTVFGKTWKVYRQMKKKDFIYLTKEKSLTFFDSVNETEMNTVEDLWRAAERPTLSGNGYLKNELGSQFCEYIYRKSLSYASDAYLEFLKDIGKIYMPHNRIDFVEESILPD